jgi:hypothetical protein
MMFIRRRSLDRRTKYSRQFFESLVAQLREAGFDDISVILPHNYPSVDPRHPEESVDDFLGRDRNFAAVILKAHARAARETLKVLFINSNAKAIFVDDTFPMAESEPSGVYFESPDPARAYGVFQFFYEQLSRPPDSHLVSLTLLGLASMVYLSLEAVALLSKGRGILQLQLSAHPTADIFTMFLAAYLVFRLSAAPSGLWIKPKRELKLIYLLNMALKGQYRDNPLFNLSVTVVGGLIVAGLAKLFGWF